MLLKSPIAVAEQNRKIVAGQVGHSQIEDAIRIVVEARDGADAVAAGQPVVLRAPNDAASRAYTTLADELVPRLQ